ncbi:hypothetical protein DAMA08_000040 [Martiniozyma asiatica (nom. inval.)]|nr:hypothetical protein DAMA08_000040 [Martiniozyma asiatica]
MSMFTDMLIVAFLTPISNYVNNKKCEILGRYNDELREDYAKHWVDQTQVYGKFVKQYLDLDKEK